MRERVSAARTFGTSLVTLLIAGCLLVGMAYVYLRYGHPPVAVTDKPFPDEEKIVHVPLNARIDREVQTSPLQVTPANLEAGAHVYMTHCAVCHGSPGHDSPLENAMYPMAPQLWKAHGHGGVVGVSDDPAGETYWKVANGIRLTGMPEFRQMLSETQMWQVSLLASQADKPLPEPVQQVLHGPVMVPAGN